MKTTPSYLTISLLVIGLICLGTGFAQAAEIFFDDFSDGSVTNDVPLAADGVTPVIWTEWPLNPSPTTFDASSGDLIMSSDGDYGVGNADQFILTDTSIRTQIRRVADRVAINVGARISQTSLGGYVAGLGSTGGLFISRLEEPSSVMLRRVQTDLNPTNEDVILQFDVIGTTLSVWAWRPGEPMSIRPQAAVRDTTYAQGIVGMAVDDQETLYSEGTFRYMQVADTHIIPEPATILLALFGMAGACCFRHRH